MPLTINAAIKRTRLDLIEARGRVAALEGRLQALEEAEQELGVEYEARTARSDSSTEARTDAILAVMRTQPTTIWNVGRLKGPVGSRRGTVEESKDLAAALSYMGSQGKIWSPRRGEWLLDGMPDELTTLEREEPDPDDIPF